MTSYFNLAPFYDDLSDEGDYEEYFNFIRNILSCEKAQTVLDLACGTGEMSCRLAKEGYSVFALDISEEMLSVADNKASRQGLDIVFSHQDMRVFSLPHPVDAVISLFDSYNYLLSTTDIESSFSSVHEHLSEGGTFLFDINTKYKFENVYSDNTYSLEGEKSFCVWENLYNPKSKLCRFFLNIFSLCPDGRYERLYEEQTERCYSLKTVCKLLSSVGFSEIGVYGTFDLKPADENNDERIYIIAKK